ncbi:HAMP domain-containing protein [Desulfofundulus australicus DSM 11792]|jgi:signal transduction histidine kinase|uniref:histidine kinase n=1 Tax=Desulfofundulus australicus DSM 11792 TaxID=1121425 RepID=A0A1M5CXX2_9FIRM|nr:ATP-binding protein [Desulfofundulus australicus]SHF59497.1 HAMP domain-containing protein [Desulfofundulus australicus DSM 11792]
MKLRGIVGKLWLAMLALVVGVLGLSALIQAGILEKIYYQQQVSRLVEQGERLAGLLVEQQDPYLAARQVDLLARLMNASVMVVDPRGYVEHWQAMGMGKMMPHMGGPPWSRGNQGWEAPRRGRTGSGQAFNPGPDPGAGNGAYCSYGEEGSLAAMMPFDREQIQQVLAGEKVVRREYNPFFNTDVVVAGIPLVRDDQFLGALFIHAPVAPLAANLKALQQSSLYALVLGAVMATLLGLFLSRTLAGPLVEMDRVARAMARGDFARQVTVRSRDEIGDLARSLNTLSRELQEKISALQKIDAARREFVANVSHELRTPLTIIQGYTEAILDGLARDEGQRREYMQNILEEILRLRRLVDDLLDLRRMESGQFTLRKQPVDMGALVHQVVERFAGVAGERGIHLEVQLPDDLPPVCGDGDRLAQVLYNLIDNALRVTPAGGRVEVAARQGAGRVEVAVKDTGPGIPAHEIPLIWERFYKGDPSRRRAGGGSGLGLAIARQIIDLHGGEIKVESEPGRGAVFTITLDTYKRTEA